MRKVIGAAILAAHSLVWAELPAEEPQLLVATPGIANVRAEPSMDSPIVDRVKRGAVLYRREGDRQGRFIPVRFGEHDSNGWIHDSVVAPFWKGTNG